MNQSNPMVLSPTSPQGMHGFFAPQMYQGHMPGAPATYGMTHTGMHGISNPMQPYADNLCFGQVVALKHPEAKLHILPRLEANAKIATVNNGIVTVHRPIVPTLELTQDMPASTQGASTQLKVKTTNGIIENMAFTVAPFGEQFLITAVHGSKTVTVRRQLGSWPAARVKAGTPLIYSGDLFEEGSLRPLGNSSGGESMRFQLTLTRHGWARTKSFGAQMQARAAQMGNQFSESLFDQEKYAYLRHAMSMEKSALFAQVFQQNLNGMPINGTSGLIEWVAACAPQNIITAAKPLTLKDIAAMFDLQSNVQVEGAESLASDKVYYANRFAIQALTTMAESQATPFINISETPAPLVVHRVHSFRTPLGEYMLVEHPMLNQHPYQAGMVIGIDFANFQMHYLEGRRSVVERYNQNGEHWTDGGVDAEGGSIISEYGFSSTNPAAHMIIFNLLEGIKQCLPCGGGANPYAMQDECDQPVPSSEEGQPAHMFASAFPGSLIYVGACGDTHDGFIRVAPDECRSSLAPHPHMPNQIRSIRGTVAVKDPKAAKYLLDAASSFRVPLIPLQPDQVEEMQPPQPQDAQDFADTLLQPTDPNDCSNVTGETGQDCGDQ